MHEQPASIKAQPINMNLMRRGSNVAPPRSVDVVPTAPTELLCDL
jgi:hypothetical protein